MHAVNGGEGIATAPDGAVGYRVYSTSESKWAGIGGGYGKIILNRLSFNASPFKSIIVEFVHEPVRYDSNSDITRYILQAVNTSKGDMNFTSKEYRNNLSSYTDGSITLDLSQVNQQAFIRFEARPITYGGGSAPMARTFTYIKKITLTT